MNFCAPLCRSIIALENDWMAEGFRDTGCYERICRYNKGHVPMLYPSRFLYKENLYYTFLVISHNIDRLKKMLLLRYIYIYIYIYIFVLFVFLALQPIVVVFSQPGNGL
jgi:hypothetical protein